LKSFVNYEEISSAQDTLEIDEEKKAENVEMMALEIEALT